MTNTPTTPLSSSRNLSAGVRLALMMLFQYAVWGIWLPVLGNYLKPAPEAGGLGFTDAQLGWILGLAGAIGAVFAPFIAGQVADRYLNAERALGILLLLGGGTNILLAHTHNFYPFMFLAIAYSIVYMPTLSLTNSIAFQNLTDPEKTFPPIRLFGTLGWIIASIAFTKLWLTASDPVLNTRRIADALTVSGILSIVYAMYAFIILPKTPPKKVVKHPLAFVDAFALLKNPAFLLVTLAALPIAMIHQVYFMRAGLFFENGIGIQKQNLGWVLGIGQASEIFFLLILGVFIQKLGYKWVLVTGTLAYAARFAIFAIGAPAEMVVISQVLHGLCYGCFFAGSFLLVEKLASEDIRHSAQTVFGIIILGVGPIAAGFYNQFVLGQFDLADGKTNFTSLWLVQSGIAFATMLVLLVAFPRKTTASPSGE